MKIDINKQYKTRDGQDVKIYTTEHEGMFPVLGAIGTGVVVWRGDGKFSSSGEDDLDLVEVKPEQVVWVLEDGDDETLLYFFTIEGFARSHRSAHGGTLYRVTLTDDMVVE